MDFEGPEKKREKLSSSVRAVRKGIDSKAAAFLFGSVFQFLLRFRTYFHWAGVRLTIIQEYGFLALIITIKS